MNNSTLIINVKPNEIDEYRKEFCEKNKDFRAFVRQKKYDKIKSTLSERNKQLLDNYDYHQFAFNQFCKANNFEPFYLGANTKLLDLIEKIETEQLKYEKQIEDDVRIDELKKQLIDEIQLILNRKRNEPKPTNNADSN